jgi:hypothetical protein
MQYAAQHAPQATCELSVHTSYQVDSNFTWLRCVPIEANADSGGSHPFLDCVVPFCTLFALSQGKDTLQCKLLLCFASLSSWMSALSGRFLVITVCIRKWGLVETYWEICCVPLTCFTVLKILISFDRYFDITQGINLSIVITNLIL